MDKKIFFFATFILVCALALVILIHPNRELDQDLGRHIKLGEIIWQTRQIPRTNLFSFTHSDFPFLNHHWGSEVVFYLLAVNFGLLSISYLKILILFAAILLVLFAARKNSSWPVALLAATLFLPLLIPRTLERPEIFGYFFFCLYLCLYIKERSSKQVKALWAVPLLAFLWINLHLSFAYGFLLLALCVVDAWMIRERGKAKTLVIIAAVSAAVSLINPHGLQGLLYPLQIFQNYGYSIQENQNLFFLGGLTSNIFLKMFWIVFGLSIISFILYCAAVYRKKANWPEGTVHIALLGVFGILGIMAYRNMPFFVFAGIISTSFFLDKAVGKKAETALLATASIVASLFIILIASGWFSNTFDLDKKMTLEVKEQYNPGVEFFIGHNLPGPIFNNFDIGGYLDYRLYPQEKVFVDNRPEAYPAEFFDEYKNAQQDKSKTEAFLKKYNIQTIIFSHTDGTPWAGEFVHNLPTLQKYKIVYLDAAVVIATANERELAPVIDKNMAALIEKTSDFRALISLYSLFKTWDKADLAQAALEKAHAMRPESCGIRLQYGITKVRDPHLPRRRQGKDVLQSAWYCPYPRYIRQGLEEYLSSGAL